MPATPAESLVARRDLGDAVLHAASALDAKRLGPKLTLFRKAHATLRRAEDALHAAEARLAATKRALAEADHDQDAAVAALATALVTAGQPRLNPFRKLSKYAPARLQQIGYADEAQALLELSLKSRKVPGVNPAVLAASRDAERVARALLDAFDDDARAEARRDDARERCDRLSQPWETALEGLRRAARAADAQGPDGLYDALFRVGSRRPRSTPPRPL
ncbi:MAG: hypothetical protein U0325_01085 [Polyangiales bacterium]